jgi:outer membrane protein
MKKLLLLSIVLVSAITIFAQTQKGNFVLSGGTGLQFTSSNIKYVYDGETEGTGTISSFTFIPSFAYFIMDNLAIGLASNFTTSSNKDEDGDKYNSNSSLIVPTAIYYFPIEGKIRPLAQFGVGLSSQSTKYILKTGSDNKSSMSGLAINFGGGVSYFINESFSLNFGLSYTLANLKDGDDDKGKIKQGNFGSNIGLSIYF